MQAIMKASGNKATPKAKAPPPIAQAEPGVRAGEPVAQRGA
ncbi:MAG TPA: hypothetical protein VK751_14080 [Undibacterium sp.]|nr:hypothetical protein [Undibacterium sp.]